jgi:glycosyltransferase involved in cell wall biosynthesis
MSDEPLVSVIIIFWNAERFLQEAIRSVFAQTYRAWELLLVDDGSTDGSTAVAREWAGRYPERVRYIEHEGHANKGMSAARNLGIRHARGGYIALLDADDVWFGGTLANQVAILEAQPSAAMVYGPIQYWHSWTGESGDADRDRVEELGVPPDRLFLPPFLLPRFLRDKAAVPSGLLVRREIIDRIGGFEERFRGEYEDQVFCAKVCLSAPVFASGQCWYRYRQHPASCVMIGQQTGATHAARLRFLEWLAAYLQDQQVRERAVWWALEVELWRYRHPLAFRLLQRGDRLVSRLQHLLREYGSARWRSRYP